MPQLDVERTARLERARQHAERQARIGIPRAKPRAKQIAAAEAQARNGEPEPVKPKMVEKAVEITEVDLKRATKALKEPWRWWK